MKVDFETAQFERQLKKAKRLSLLDFKKTERRRKQLASTKLAKELSAQNVAAKEKTTCSPLERNVFHDSKRSSNSYSDKNNSSLKAHDKGMKLLPGGVVRKPKINNVRKMAKTVRKLINRSKMKQDVKNGRITVRRTSSVLRETVMYTDPRRFVEVRCGGRIHPVDTEARLQFVSASEFSDSDCGMEEVHITDNLLDGQHGIAKKLPQASCRPVKNFILPSGSYQRPDSYYRCIEQADNLEEEVEYDMDEEDFAWLSLLNAHRRKGKAKTAVEVTPEMFETVIDCFEKEAFQLGPLVVTQTASDASSVAAEDDAACAVCADDECTNTNAILFCDSCNLAVHQECYGIPYVPEGQWLCRRCQAGESDDVECCLCPIRGGAVKRTDDGRWAHVVCALWVPEVGFGSIEQLEPITKLARVPPARRRLTCAVCSKSGVGACVQCVRKNCYRAFHITCAQQVGLYMKIEPVLNTAGDMINVSKTILCNDHKPAGARPFQPMIDNSIDNDGRPPAPKKIRNRSPRSRAKKDRKGSKMGGVEQGGTYVCKVPTISRDRLLEISKHVPFRDKYHLVNMLHAYWTLKRRSRNGLPLVRRLQQSTITTSTADKTGDNKEEEEVSDMLRIKKLRQQMEKVRLLLELIRKRERTKRELLKVHETMLLLKLEPFVVHLRRTLEQLQQFDTADIFAQPVSIAEAPDYYARIKKPMDFSTMRTKIDLHEYETFADFEADFWRIVNNCQAYNDDESFYYLMAEHLADKAKPVLESARQAALEAGYCSATGMHNVRHDDPDLRDMTTSPKSKSSPTGKRRLSTQRMVSSAAECDRLCQDEFDAVPVSRKIHRFLSLDSGLLDEKNAVKVQSRNTSPPLRSRTLSSAAADGAVDNAESVTVKSVCSPLKTGVRRNSFTGRGRGAGRRSSNSFCHGRPKSFLASREVTESDSTHEPAADERQKSVSERKRSPLKVEIPATEESAEDFGSHTSISSPDLSPPVRKRKLSSLKIEIPSPSDNSQTSVLSPPVEPRPPKRKTRHSVLEERIGMPTEDELSKSPLPSPALRRRSNALSSLEVQIPTSTEKVPEGPTTASSVNTSPGSDAGPVPFQRRLRSSRSSSGAAELLVSLQSGPLTPRRRRYGTKGATDDDEGPPQLSRCPSPVNDETSVPVVVPQPSPEREVTSAKHQPTEPPQLVPSLPESTASSVGSPEPTSEHPAESNSNSDSGTMPLLEHSQKCETDGQTPLTDNECDAGVPELSLSGDAVKTPEPEDTATLSDGNNSTPCQASSESPTKRQIGSPDDTLDSVSSESQTFVSKPCSYESGIFERIMPMLTSDCDSSYGSACGRDATPTPDSEKAASTSSGHCSSPEKLDEIVSSETDAV